MNGVSPKFLYSISSSSSENGHPEQSEVRTAFKNVVKFNVYLTNMDDIGKLKEIRMRYFTRPSPATTAVEVTRLTPGVLLEMEAVAVVD